MARIPTDLTPATVLKEVAEPLQQNVVTGEIYAKVDSTDNKGWAKFVTNNIKSVFNYDSSVSLPAIILPTTIVNKEYVDNAIAGDTVTNALTYLKKDGSNVITGNISFASNMSLPSFNLPEMVINKAYVDSKLSAISKTVPLAKITVGGADGSITIVAGVITAVVDPT